MESICSMLLIIQIGFNSRLPSCVSDLNRVQADAALGDTPLWFGEWGLPTQFNATDEFLYMWADAQKLAYSQGAGWIVSRRLSALPAENIS